MNTVQSHYKQISTFPLIYDAEIFKTSARTKSNFEKSGLEASRLHCTCNNHRALKV
jgi:hypothetical protein